MMIIFWLSLVFLTFIAVLILIVPTISFCSKTGLKRNILDIGVIFAFAFLLGIGTWGLYFRLGASHSWFDYRVAQKNKAKIEEEISRLGDIDHIIFKLRKQVEQDPEAKGWFLLGKLYLKTKQFAQAVNAFDQANQMRP